MVGFGTFQADQVGRVDGCGELHLEERLAGFSSGRLIGLGGFLAGDGRRAPLLEPLFQCALSARLIGQC